MHIPFGTGALEGKRLKCGDHNCCCCIVVVVDIMIIIELNDV
jgi:hypothetical protein